jgi:tetrahydromethanopterin S-methyltransferase subunit F
MYPQEYDLSHNKRTEHCVAIRVAGVAIGLVLSGIAVGVIVSRKHRVS